MRGALTAAAMLLASPVAAQPVMTLAPGETLLTVEAQGEAKSRPDMMTISAGGVTTGRTSQEALRANSELVSRLIDVVRGSGIEPRDIRTTNLRVEPRFEPNEEERAYTEGRPPRIIGYVAQNQLEISFRDLERAAAIMEALFAAGANSVSGPTFSLRDPAPARRAAERDAAEQARIEAESYAAAFGKRVARVIRISERRSWTEDGGEAIVVTGSRMGRPPIEPGELTTRTTVYVDFALVDE